MYKSQFRKIYPYGWLCGHIYSCAFQICVIVFVSFELIVFFAGKSSDWVIIIYKKKNSISAEGLCWRNHKPVMKS